MKKIISIFIIISIIGLTGCTEKVREGINEGIDELNEQEYKLGYSEGYEDGVEDEENNLDFDSSRHKKSFVPNEDWKTGYNNGYEDGYYGNDWNNTIPS